MAFPTAVNDQITDIVSQSDVDVLKEDPETAAEAMAEQGMDSEGSVLDDVAQGLAE